MRYLHYWHFNKVWYAKLSDSNDNKVYWHNMQELWNEEYLISGSEGLTEKQIRAKLIETYPDFILIKDKPYHEGRRWFGYKDGSRR